MQLTLLAAALLPLVSAQALFGGDSCNLNIADFKSGANPSLPTSGKVDYKDGKLVMTLTPPGGDPTASGNGAIGTSTNALLYGSVEAVIQQSTIGGAVTYLTLINQATKDEIDFEWIGNERSTVWTNFFYRGLREREPVTLNEVWSSQVGSGAGDNSQTAHTYRIDWTPEAITWYVDGSVVRTQLKSETYEAAGQGDGLPYNHYHYPNTPLTVNVGIWNYQGPIWANGPIDWSQPSAQNGFTASLLSLKVSCYQGAVPVMTDPSIVPSQPDIFHNGKQTIAPPADGGNVVAPTTTTTAIVVPQTTTASVVAPQPTSAIVVAATTTAVAPTTAAVVTTTAAVVNVAPIVPSTTALAANAATNAGTDAATAAQQTTSAQQANASSGATASVAATSVSVQSVTATVSSASKPTTVVATQAGNAGAVVSGSTVISGNKVSYAGKTVVSFVSIAALLALVL